MNGAFVKGDDQVFDSTKYLRLEIDKDGVWIQNGAPMTHPGIRAQFFQALAKTDDGGYQVRIGREVCSVIVHDAPFVVTTIDRHPGDRIILKLSDETEEELKPESLWIGKDNIPYTRIKEGAFHARFGRAAYYQLAKYIVFDEKDGKYYLRIGDNRCESPLNMES